MVIAQSTQVNVLTRTRQGSGWAVWKHLESVMSPEVVVPQGFQASETYAGLVTGEPAGLVLVVKVERKTPSLPPESHADSL